MKRKLSIFSALVVCAFVFSGCASMSSGGKNPWAPPEKKKSVLERWNERPQEKSAGTPSPVVGVAESREIAEIIFADPAKKMAVAYRLGGERVPVEKGEIFAVRGKDMTLRGVARLDVVDGETLGFTLLGGSAVVGDLAVVPGKKLKEELGAKFPSAAASTESAPR